MDRLKFFIISSIFTILLSFAFYKYGLNILKYFSIADGLANFTNYLYSYLFMFSPLISIFFLGLHKVFNKKKQLFFITAFKYILPVLLGFISIHFLELSSLLWLLAIVDILTTLISIYLATLNLKIFSNNI